MIPRIDPLPIEITFTGDYISYSITDRSGRVQSYNNVQCFGGLVSAWSRNGNKKLEDYSFHLKPNKQINSRLPVEIYKEWFELCHKHKILHPVVEVNFLKGDMFECFIKRNSMNGNQVYCALCCYRWADSNPKLLWRTIQYHNILKDKLDFWQILHYTMSGSVSNCNHSFVTIGGYEMQEKKEFLLLSIAAKKYFNNPQRYNNDNAQIKPIIDKICRELDPGNNQQYCVFQSELLNSKWVPLYNLENENLNKVMDGIL